MIAEADDGVDTEPLVTDTAGPFRARRPGQTFSEFRAAQLKLRPLTDEQARALRGLACPAGYLLVKTPITAPQVLVLMLVTGVAGAGLLMTGTRTWMLAGVALLFLSMYLDFCDGMVFRHRGEPAVRGAFLDRFNHAVIYPATAFALGFAAWTETGQFWYLPVAMIGAVFRDAFETILVYEDRILERNPGVTVVRTREFFGSGLYLRPAYAWTAPFFVLKDVANTLSQHLLVFPVMFLGVLAGLVPALVWYFLAIYVVRFFAFAVTRFAVTYRGK